jgi:hypothetical protein
MKIDMDFQKFRTQLDELSQFFAYLEQRFTPEELSELDRDTLMVYVRDLYKSFFVTAPPKPQLPLKTEAQIENKTVVTPLVADLPKVETIETVVPIEEVAAVETVETIEEVAAIEEKIAQITAEVETETVETENVETENVETENVVVLLPELVEQPNTTQETGMVIHLGTDLQAQEVHTPQIVLNTIVDDEMFEQHETRFNPDYDDLFYIKDSKELSQKLADARIDDLNKSMGLNDKFLYINELFGGNAARFKIAIDFFNSEAKSLNDARAYIERELIENFKWVTPLKSDLSKQFIKLLRRRYLK